MSEERLKRIKHKPSLMDELMLLMVKGHCDMFLSMTITDIVPFIKLKSEQTFGNFNLNG